MYRFESAPDFKPILNDHYCSSISQLFRIVTGENILEALDIQHFGVLAIRHDTFRA